MLIATTISIDYIECISDLRGGSLLAIRSLRFVEYQRKREGFSRSEELEVLEEKPSSCNKQSLHMLPITCKILQGSGVTCDGDWSKWWFGRA
jgi:hypothetical protein